MSDQTSPVGTVRVLRPEHYTIVAGPPEVADRGATAPGAEGSWREGFGGLGHPDAFYDAIDDLLTRVRAGRGPEHA